MPLLPSYEHVNSATLSLPIAPALTILTILLPLLAAANLLSLPRLLSPARKPSRAPAPSTRLLFHHGLPITLQVLQGIATTVLATLYAAHHLGAGDTRDCELATRWLRLFRAKDERAVRAVQDALQCCGFRSVRDMAWPFPPAAGGAQQCAVRFDRALACRGPWAAALRGAAGADLGVVLGVGVLQVSYILIF